MACKSGHDARALDLCKLIRSEQILNLALKYTTKTGNSNLASKITEIIESNEINTDNVDETSESYTKSFNHPSVSFK